MSVDREPDYRGVMCVVLFLLLAILSPAFYLIADSLSVHRIVSLQKSAER